MRLLLPLLLFSNLTFGQTTVIPDPNFEQVLVNQGYDDVVDGQVLTSNISSLETLTIGISANVSDLTGIQDFSSLKRLECQFQQITSLDLSQNQNLQFLSCGGGAITNLDLTGCSLLDTLLCASNQLTSIDLSTNSALIYVLCRDNLLTNLGLTNCSQLETLVCRDNLLESINLSNCSSLLDLEIDNNKLTSLNLEQNNSLLWLECQNNEIAELNLSQNGNLIAVACSNNFLTCLNLKNGNNLNMDVLITGNPSLACIEVDNAFFSTNSWTVSNGEIDPWVSFSEDCNNACSGSLKIEELSTEKELIKVVDLLGREVQPEPNKMLIYVYLDGTIERKIQIK